MTSFSTPSSTPERLLHLLVTESSVVGVNYYQFGGGEGRRKGETASLPLLSICHSQDANLRRNLTDFLAQHCPFFLTQESFILHLQSICCMPGTVGVKKPEVNRIST